MKDFSFITNSHPSYVEGLYREFVNDPNSVDPDLRKFFEGFDFAVSNNLKAASNGQPVAAPVTVPAPEPGVDLRKELGVYRLILGYRNKGHLIANTNPIRKRKDRGANLDLGFFGLNEEDLEKEF